MSIEPKASISSSAKSPESSNVDKIQIAGITKPKNLKKFTIEQLNGVLGINDMDNPREEWNALRDATRRIFYRRKFDQSSKAYQGWAKVDEEKKSKARNEVHFRSVFLC